MTMGSKPSVTEIEKDVPCTARLFSLFLMIRIGCKINDNQALFKASVNLAIWNIVFASCVAITMGPNDGHSFGSVCDHSL